MAEAGVAGVSIFARRWPQLARQPAHHHRAFGASAASKKKNVALASSSLRRQLPKIHRALVLLNHHHLAKSAESNAETTPIKLNDYKLKETLAAARRRLSCAAMA